MSGGGHRLATGAAPGVGAALAGLLALAPLVWGRQAHAWAPSLLGLCAAAPLALLVAGRGGAARATLGLLAGGLIGGELAAAWAPLPSHVGRCDVPATLVLVARAGHAGDSRSGELWLAALAALVAAPHVWPRARWRGVDGRVARGLVGGVLLAAGLVPWLPGGPNEHDLGWTLAACLAAGAAMGLGGGLAQVGGRLPRDVPPPAPVDRLWLAGAALGALLLGLVWGAACQAALRPPPASRPDTQAAREALRAIHAAQVAHVAAHGAPAASLTDLAAVSTAVRAGVSHGHVFRYGVWGTDWAAAADPQALLAGDRLPHLWIGPAGRVLEAGQPCPVGPGIQGGASGPGIQGGASGPGIPR